MVPSSLSQDAERSEAYQFRLWVIFEDKSSIDLIRQANADSEPPHEDVGNTSRPKRIDGRTPASTEKGPHALDFKLRVPVVPPVQMKDGGVSLADLLPFVSGSAGAPAHAQTANERPLDNVDEMMEPQGPAPAGWKDIDIRLEPASMLLLLTSTIFVLPRTNIYTFAQPTYPRPTLPCLRPPRETLNYALSRRGPSLHSDGHGSTGVASPPRLPTLPSQILWA